MPIPGSRSPRHIDDNVAAADVTLSTDQLARLDELLARFAPVGGALLDVATATGAGGTP